jgi:hypothetical protein
MEDQEKQEVKKKSKEVRKPIEVEDDKHGKKEDGLFTGEG